MKAQETKKKADGLYNVVMKIKQTWKGYVGTSSWIKYNLPFGNEC